MTTKTTASTLSYSNLALILRLIKYDLRYILKGPLIFGTALLASIVLFNLTYVTENFPAIIPILHTIAYNAIYSCALALVFNTAARTWYRYRSNFYGDEAYLTHTLPIKRSMLWFAKFCGVIGTILSVMLIIAFNFLILACSADGRGYIAGFSFGDNTSVTHYLILIWTVFTQVLFTILSGITGLTLGYRANKYRRGKSVTYGLVVYLAGVLLLLGLGLVASNFIPDLHKLIFDASGAIDVLTPAFISQLLLGISIIYTLYVAILYIINHRVLKSGINLE